MMFSFHLCVRRGLENFPTRWNDDQQSWLYVMVETNMMLGYVAMTTSKHMFFAAAAAALMLASHCHASCHFICKES